MVLTIDNPRLSIVRISLGSDRKTARAEALFTGFPPSYRLMNCPFRTGRELSCLVSVFATDPASSSKNESQQPYRSWQSVDRLDCHFHFPSSVFVQPMIQNLYSRFFLSGKTIMYKKNNLCAYNCFSNRCFHGVSCSHPQKSHTLYTAHTYSPFFDRECKLFVFALSRYRYSNCRTICPLYCER